MNWFIFEEAIIFLSENFNVKKLKKPTLFHSVRVWVLLYNFWYNIDLQIAWLLHDTLEDLNISEELISKKYWKNVLEIVKANSKNTFLPKWEILDDIIYRCSLYWEDALIVKTADIYDNFKYYVNINNLDEIKRCKNLANLIIKYKKINWNSEIFNLLDEIINY